jgi:tetratricopeptide (TPR) repeat protein
MPLLANALPIRFRPGPTLCSLIALCGLLLVGSPSALQAQTPDDAVIEAMLAYVDRHPQDLNRRQQLVDRLLREGRLETALSHLEDLHERRPNAPHLLRQLATLYDWTQRPQAALNTYEQLARLRPTDVSLHQELARRYRWVNQMDKSIDHLERVVELQPENLSATFDLAQLHLWTNRPERARSLLLDLLDASPSNLAARRLLANLYFWTERPAQGIDQLEWIVSEQPWNLDTRERLAQHYFWTDQPTRGLLQLESILQQAPDRDSLRHELMQRAFDHGQAERGLHHLEVLVNRHPADVPLRRMLAERYLWVDRLADNIEQLEHLLTHTPADTTVRRTLAKRLFATNQPERGLHHLEVLVEQHPTDRSLRAALTTRYTDLGRTDAAIEQYRWFVEHPPAPARMKTHFLQSLLWTQRYEEVIAYGEPMLATTPDHVDRRFLVAQAQAWSNQPQAALAHLDTLLSAVPHHAEALLLAGELQRWEPTQWPAARGKLHRALALLPDTSANAARAHTLLRGLRRDYGSAVETRLHHQTDSNERSHTYAPIRTNIRLGGLWRGIVEAGPHWFHDAQLSPDAAGLRGYEGRAGVHTRLPSGTALQLSGTATVYAPGWSAFGGTVQVQQPLGPLTLSTQYHHREARESVASLQSGIRTHRLDGSVELRAGNWLTLTGQGAHTWYSNNNRREALAGAARLRVLGEPFTVALLGRYRYENTERIFSDSRPYWTPDQLHTLSGALSLDLPLTSGLTLGGTYGLSDQDGVLGHDYGGRLGLSAGFHSVQASVERFGSGTYAYRAFALRYAYRF